MTGMLGIVLSLAALIVLAYRGLTVLLLAPLAALAAVLASAGTPLLASYTQVFMPALGGFVIAYFPLFLLGAVFGRLMDDSGAARSIATTLGARFGRERAIAAIVAACALLTYGGVSLFVVAFAVYPLAVELFRAADLPRRLVPGTIALGAFTFTMTALPGTPAIQNAIPMPYFGTTPFAAPGLGVIGGATMLAIGLAWLAINYVVGERVLPRLDTGYLAEAAYGATRLDAVRGVWAIVVALAASILLIAVLHRRRLRTPAASLEAGALACLAPIFNTASLVGYGAVVASLPAFAAIRDAVLGLAPGNPLVSLSVAVNVLAGITGSASGGMSIALQTLGADYLARAAAAGIDPALLHRVTAIATGGLDALPHNGAVITLLAICGLTHRQSYLDILVVAVLGPLVALAVVIALGTAFGAF